MRKILLSGIFGDHLPVTLQVSNNIVPITYLQKRSFLKKKKKQSVREMERETERHVKLEYTEVNVKQLKIKMYKGEIWSMVLNYSGRSSVLV